jgi:hypothetical protein
MEYVPVFYLSKKFGKNDVKPMYLRDIMKKHGFSDLYVIDEQGIKLNEPNYSFYQRYSSLFDLWVDTGPRDIGDVVDDIFSGAKRIVIRLNLWNEESLSKIKALTDHELYLAVNGSNIQVIYEHPGLFEQANGIVLFMTNKFRVDFKQESKISQIIKDKPTYVFDDDENERYWASKNIKGFLKDINLFV